MAERLASSSRSASSCRASGRRMGKASGWVLVTGCLLRHGWSVPGRLGWSWAATRGHTPPSRASAHQHLKRADSLARHFEPTFYPKGEYTTPEGIGQLLKP